MGARPAQGVTSPQERGLGTGSPDRGLDPAALAGHVDHPPRMGFFTDTSVCIGCKACEVACKEWNAVPEDGLELTGMSYDNTGKLGASTWRHVAFIEQSRAARLTTRSVLSSCLVPTVNRGLLTTQIGGGVCTGASGPISVPEKNETRSKA